MGPERFFDRVDALVVVLDRDGRVSALNRRASEVLGREPEELVGADWFETCLPAGVREETRSGFGLLVAGELAPLEFHENPVLAKSGEEVRVAWHNHLVREGGRTVGIWSTGTVVTPRVGARSRDRTGRRVEGAATARARVYRELFDSAPIGYLVVGADGKVRLANARAGEILGARPEALQERPVDDLVVRGEPQSEEAIEALRSMPERAHLFHRELPLRTDDGRSAWARMMVEPIRDAAGTVVETRWAMVDVTNLHEEAERARLYAAIVHAMPVGVVVYEAADAAEPAQLRFVAENAAARRARPGAAGGDPPLAGPTLAQVLESGTPRVLGEVAVEDGDARRWFQVEAFPLGPRRVAVAYEDVTERKSAELALAQREAELARSNKDLELFAQITSHDLRAPLQVILGRLELLQARLGPAIGPEDAHQLEVAQESVLRMGALLDEMLAYSRVGTGARSFVEVDVTALLRHVLVDLEIVLGDAGAVVREGDLPVVTGNGVQLAQLFRNLLGNAVKFRSTAPLRIDVTAEPEGDRWHFRVADNGQGFAEVDAEVIFDLFRRGRDAERVRGSGLGLAICRKIVLNHGGRIWAEGRPGEGAVFHFTLPAVLKRTPSSR